MKNIKKRMFKEDKLIENKKAKTIVIQLFNGLSGELKSIVAAKPDDGSDSEPDSGGLESD